MSEKSVVEKAIDGEKIAADELERFIALDAGGAK